MEKINNIIVDFELLFDTDIGLLRLIQDKYNNDEFILPYVKNMDTKVMIHEVINRDTINPLSLVVQDNYLPNIDSLYEEFIEDEYEYILEHSEKTSILGLIITYLNTEGINVNIICKNKFQEQLIKKLNISKLSVDIVTQWKYIDLSQYSSIFIKDYSKVLEFNGLTAKNIFIGNYKYNLEDDNRTPLLNISMIVSNSNIVSIIDVYESNKYTNVQG